MEKAVQGFRKSGRKNYLPHGLLARAALFRVQKIFLNAWYDLQEVREIAEWGNMKLYLTDYNLEAARLISDQQSANNSQFIEQGREVTLSRDEMVDRLKMHVEQAAELVQETGYHRRDPEVEMGSTSLFLAQGDQVKAREHLAKAKGLLDKMGTRCWDFEVRRLEQLLGN